MKTRFLVPLLLILTGLACNRDQASSSDKTPPVIQLTTPVNGQVFTAGQTITITGTISDDEYITESHVHLTDLTSAVELLDVHLTPGAGPLNFSQTWTAAAGHSYRVTIMAFDRAAHETIVKADISCN